MCLADNNAWVAHLQVCKDYKGSFIQCGEFSLNKRCDGNSSVRSVGGWVTRVHLHSARTLVGVGHSLCCRHSFITSGSSGSVAQTRSRIVQVQAYQSVYRAFGPPDTSLVKKDVLLLTRCACW